MKKLNRILIVGAGEAGAALVNDLRQRGLGNGIAAFVDDDPSKPGTTVSGIEVRGGTSDLPVICSELEITDVIIAIPSAKTSLINRITSKVLSCSRSINILFVPSAERFFDTVPIFPSLREFSYSDLLGREEFSINLDIMENYFRGKSVLITGGGGSIGSEICRQLLKFNVKKIIAVGRGENSIYNLIKEMDEYSRLMPGRMPETVYMIADVRDRRGLARVFRHSRPDIVFHAAAHKHVPLMESNECEAFQNNVLGTDNTLSLSAEYGVSRFILVSTDKAVRPTNVMGATKRICELITAYYHNEKKLNTSAVRFGNVLGSRGSVIPLFMEQIEKGGPVTVTDPEITRYFMSIPEASLLVINSAAISKGGEIFVLDMGEQYRIDDIARRMIELYGFTPDRDIKIEYTGLRPGEKMYEELFYNRDSMDRTGNESILTLHNDSRKLSADDYCEIIETVKDGIYDMDGDSVRRFIKKFVPEYVY
ncbi:MAG TPA: nucleoside-diphosphate sugar epimerase/dehydratase [Spirochaetota bacterium]|nr:nucleoside-diphosphate sugar epimerase/dehydratase [Spirochaetota bacterium]HPJ34781.1 nucleoside-diphosphate sugar epimerase/dehydratase [Spirochaetota bacterium]